MRRYKVYVCELIELEDSETVPADSPDQDMVVKLEDYRELERKIHQLASDGWSTSGSDRALERIIELTTLPKITNSPKVNRV